MLSASLNKTFPSFLVLTLECGDPTGKEGGGGG